MKTLAVLGSVILVIWITSYSANGQEIRVVVNVNYLNFRNVDTILHALRKYGKTNRPTDVKNSTEQFTCTTVLAEEEVKKPGSKISETLDFIKALERDGRIRVQYNENQNHGEKIVLKEHIGDLIKKMQENSRQKHFNTYPIVIMYSYNIPCSMTEHECAKLLSEHKAEQIGKETEYSMIVGFSVFFGFYGNRTRNIQNRQESFRKLTEQSIAVLDFFNMYRDIQFASLVLQDKHLYGHVSFQSVMFDCLIKQPVVHACIPITKVDPGHVANIIAFAIDNMVFDCQRFAQDYVNIKTWEDSSLKICFDEWIRDYIGGNRHTCGRAGMWKFLLQEAIKQGRRMATFLGEPFKYAFDKSYVPSWIYQLPPQLTISSSEYKRNSGYLVCHNGCSPESFCTRREDKEQNNFEQMVINKWNKKIQKKKDSKQRRKLKKLIEK